MKVAVVIVTCDAPERVKKHLGILSTQSRKPDLVVLVNNGKQDIKWAAEEFPGLEFKMLAFDNIGPAGGFKEGAKRAYASGAECIIFADDDAFPVGEKVVQHLLEDVEGGKLIATGYYTDGAKIGSSNHYFAYHREVFEKVGFYFDPFFLMNEDVEYQFRIAPITGIFFDERVLIDHPWRLTTDSLRSYLSTRNSFIGKAMYNGYAEFMALFYHYLYRAVYSSIFLKKPTFGAAFAKACIDFALRRNGRPEIGIDRLDLREVDPKDIEKDGPVVFLGIGLNVKPPCETKDDIREGFKASGSLSQALNAIGRFSGSNVILANLFMLSYPPFTLLTRGVYWYDVLKEKTFLLYRNNPIVMGIFIAVLVPLALALTPLAIIAFGISQGYYKDLLKKKIQKDKEFCSSNRGNI